MVYFLPSDVARLVLGYLKEHKFSKTYTSFLKECPHLREYYELLGSGTFEASPFGLSLLVILEEWGQYRQKGSQKTAFESRSPGPNTKKQTRKLPDRKQQRQSPSHRSITKSPETIVIDSLEDTDDSSPESDEIIVPRKTQGLIVNLTDRESSEDDVNFQRSSVSFNSSKLVLRQQNIVSPRKSCLSKSPGKSGHVHFTEKSSNSRITLLQSSNLINSSSKPDDRPKYPNLVNLLKLSSSSKKKEPADKPCGSDSEQVLEPIEIPSNDNNNTDSIGSTPELVEVETESVHHDSVTHIESSQRKDSTGTPVLQTIHASSSTSPVKSSNNGKNSKILQVQNKELIQSLHRTPHKTSPQKMVSMVTPVKLFQDGETDSSTRSPRRKKPKTPRKRNSDVSPSGSVKEGKATAEDKLPLFQQVLSDRRLHEKLAETCNIVSGQLKLSLSGSSANGDKTRIIITPPRTSEHEELEPATTSRSLEDILDLDTNYASELLSENIDMSDPAFECLFKLFGTDKESFSESIRKETQKAEKETEKLTKDLEELERSINEEFGTNAHQADLHSDAESHVSVSQQLSQPSSPYINQAACPSPFIARDGINHILNGDGTGHFTSLLRGHELGSSPAQSTPSRKSNFSSSQYVGSPSSVATQPFSPYNAPSPASLYSPRSNIPETPRSQLSIETLNSPVTIETAGSSGVYSHNLHHTPSGRSSASNGFSQSTPHQSSQPVPAFCSPLVTSEIHAGSPIMSQRDVPYTPQAKKRIFTPVDNRQLVDQANGSRPYHSNIHQTAINDQVLINDNKMSSSTVNLEGDSTVLYQTNDDISSTNVSLIDANNSLHSNFSSNEVNYSQNNHGNIIYINGHAENNIPQRNTECGRSKSINLTNTGNLIQNVDYASTVTAPCTTIANTIGCISLPGPAAIDLSTSPEDEKHGGKKKRSTRSDKGKKRKKPLQGNQSKSTEAEVPVLKDLLSKPTLPGLTLDIQEPTTLTAENFRDQHLVMLSPGGQNTLALPILSCVDAISNSSVPFETSVACSENELDQSACVSLQPENQATSALVKSIKSGNTAEILNQARDIVKDSEDKKRVSVKGKEEKKRIVPKMIKKRDEKLSKKEHKLENQRNQSIFLQSQGDLNPGPDEILYATPLNMTIGKKYVRSLDFDKKYREIQPKPPMSNLTVVAKTICMPNSTEDSTVNSSDGKVKFNTTRNGLIKSTSSHDDKSSTNKKENASLSIDNPMTLKTNSSQKPLACNKLTETESLRNSIRDTGASKSKSPSTERLDNIHKSSCDKAHSIQKSNKAIDDSKKNEVDLTLETDKFMIVNKSTCETESSAKDSDQVTERRCTRSSKPATMERLNDKGVPETISNDSESKSNSSSSSSMGHKQFRRKPKTGKDMRMIIKHLKSVEDEDDVFSTFSDNSVDSIICDQSSAVDTESENPVGGQESGAETVKKYKCVSELISGTGTGVEISNSVIPKSAGCNVDSFDNFVTASKSDCVKTAQQFSPNKNGQKKGETTNKAASRSKETASKRPSPKKSTRETKKKAKAIVIESESSDEDIPLSQLKVNTSRSKTEGGKGVFLRDRKFHSDKKLSSTKHDEDSRDKFDLSDGNLTPTKSPRDFKRTSSSELLTPSKEMWMEQVGLTPTKQLKAVLDLESPEGKSNSPSSEIRNCLTPMTRSKFRSSLKSPVTKVSSAKKLFQSSPNSKTKHTELRDKKFTKAKVDLMIKTLHDNNPESSLVNKISPKSSEEKSINRNKNLKNDKGLKNIKDQSSFSGHRKDKESLKSSSSIHKDTDKNSVSKSRSTKNNRESNKDKMHRKSIENDKTDTRDLSNAKKSKLNRKSDKSMDICREDKSLPSKVNSTKKDLQLKCDEKTKMESCSSKCDLDYVEHSAKKEKSPRMAKHSNSDEKENKNNSGKSTGESKEKKSLSRIKESHSDVNIYSVIQSETISTIIGCKSSDSNKISGSRRYSEKSDSCKDENMLNNDNAFSCHSKTRDKTETKKSDYSSKNDLISGERNEMGIKTKLQLVEKGYHSKQVVEKVTKTKISDKNDKDKASSKISSEKTIVLSDNVPKSNEIGESNVVISDTTNDVSEDKRNNANHETDAATDFLVRQLQTDADYAQSTWFSDSHCSQVNDYSNNIDPAVVLNHCDKTGQTPTFVKDTTLTYSEGANKSPDHTDNVFTIKSIQVPNSDAISSTSTLGQSENRYINRSSDSATKNSDLIEEKCKQKGTKERTHHEKVTCQSEMNMNSKTLNHKKTADECLQENHLVTATTLDKSGESLDRHVDINGNTENEIDTNTVTPSARLSADQSTTSSRHHHHHRRHSSGKKKKKKSKKRHREESREGENEQEPKKKKRRHEKHKDKHHRKHKKSSKLSSLDVEAALSQIYSSDTTPAESPLKMTEQTDTPADCPYRTPLPNGHLPSMFGHHLSNKDGPLQQSTPIVNSNLARIGAFGTLFSPVSDSNSAN